MGRDHSCEDCGRGGFNDPDGECVCPPPDPLREALSNLIERVESNLREPDKLLCATLSAKRELTRFDLALSEKGKTDE